MSFGLYLIFVALLYLRPIEAFAPELSPYRPMMFLSLATLAVSLASAFVGGAAAARRQPIGLLLAFAAAIALSQIWAGWAGGALTALGDFSISAILFVTTLINVNGMRRLRVSCAVLAACIVVQSAAAIAAYHTGFMADKLVVQQSAGEDAQAAAPADALNPIVPADDKSGTRLWRVRSLGFFADPNDFAQGIVVALPFVAALYLRRRALRDLLLIVIPGAALLYALFLTHSRGALVGLAGMLFFGASRAWGTARAAALLVVIGSAALVLNFTGGRAYADDDSASGRIDAWVQGLRMLQERPLFGVGYHNFTEYNPLTAHNSYVLCFAELGLVGYIVWLGMLFVSARRINQAFALSPIGSDERRWASVLSSALVGFLACAFFLSRTYEPLLYHMLALCLAAAYCTERILAPEAAAQLRMPVRWARTVLVIAPASLIMLYAFLRARTALLGG